MYICPERPGLRFGKTEMETSLELYHIPVCVNGTFLGKLTEFPETTMRLLGVRRWNMDVRLKNSLQMSDHHRGFHTAQRGKDFIQAHLEAQNEVRDVQGRPLRLAQ